MGTYSRILNQQPQASQAQAEGPQQTVRTNDDPNERTIFRTHEQPNGRTVVAPKRRTTRRYSFEFYEDQILRLKQVKFEAEMRGEVLYLSDIVRQALDRYFEAGDI